MWGAFALFKWDFRGERAESLGKRTGREKENVPTPGEKEAGRQTKGEGSGDRPAGKTERELEAVGQRKGRPLPKSAPSSSPEDRLGLRAQNSPGERGSGGGAH